MSGSPTSIFNLRQVDVGLVRLTPTQPHALSVLLHAPQLQQWRLEVGLEEVGGIVRRRRQVVLREQPDRDFLVRCILPEHQPHDLVGAGPPAPDGRLAHVSDIGLTRPDLVELLRDGIGADDTDVRDSALLQSLDDKATQALFDEMIERLPLVSTLREALDLDVELVLTS